MDVWRDFLINFQRRGQRVAGVANPSVDFTDASPRLRVTKIFKDWINTYVTLATKFRNIFKEPKLRHSTAAESRKCLGCPDMKYSSRRFLRQPRLWNLSRDLWQGHAVSTTADRSFVLNIRPAFHDQTDLVSDRWNSERISFTRWFNVQSI